jgi:poly(hydroxyalkanoate) granule-associated protein
MSAKKSTTKTEAADRFGTELREGAHKIWLAGLGAFTVAEEEGNKLFKSLVERGEEFESRGRDRVEKVKTSVEEAAKTTRERIGDAWSSFETGLDEKVAAAVHKLGVPTREEIHTLTKRVEELTTAVESLRAKKG